MEYVLHRGGVNSVTRDRYEVNGSKLTIYSTFDSSEFSEEHAEEYEYEINDNMLTITSSKGRAAYYTRDD